MDIFEAGFGLYALEPNIVGRAIGEFGGIGIYVGVFAIIRPKTPDAERSTYNGPCESPKFGLSQFPADHRILKSVKWTKNWYKQILLSSSVGNEMIFSGKPNFKIHKMDKKLGKSDFKIHFTKSDKPNFGVSQGVSSEPLGDLLM